MSDAGFDGSVAGAATTTFSAPAGQLLRQAREAQGLHIGALAVALKVPVKKLEALEAGRFEELPDMVFARSLALSVCRALKVDPAPVLASLPEPQANHFKIREPGLNTTFKDSAIASHRGLRAQLTSPIGLGVLALVIAIVVILAWPDRPLLDSSSLVSKGTSEPALSYEPQDVQAPLNVASGAEATSATTAPPIDIPSSADAGVDSKVVAALPSAAVAAVATPDANLLSSVMELRGLGESWVEVTDGAGRSQVHRLIQSGEVIQVTGPLPLSVTVGRADKVSVSVRGKPMDLAPLARSNVAKFEVK